MPRTKQYRCPVCGKPLTKREYESALRIQDERDKHARHELDELRAQLRKTRGDVKKAHADGVRAEHNRTQRLLQGKEKTIQMLKERIAQVRRGTTPQTEGLEFEEKLAARLRREFPDDDIQLKGKGGDVLQVVRFETKVAGNIIYECKRTPGIPFAHVSQTAEAKRTRSADFAVLVTTGQRRGFAGLTRSSGVLIVSPLGAIPLADLLRVHLIEMLRAKVTREKRAAIASQLMGYITSPQFRNPIEDVVCRTVELKRQLQDEARDHAGYWQKRWRSYEAISWNSEYIRSNIQLVMHGKQTRPLVRHKPEPLALPAPPRVV